MEPLRILSKAEVWKRRTHRLTFDLRLRSMPEARKFIREQSAVLWNTRAEIPNLMDAMVGRIANGNERASARLAENCALWREQILQEPEFLECNFFRKRSTVLHQDLWPYATVFAKLNRKKATNEHLVSKEARKILTFIHNEGPSQPDQVRRALKFNSVAEKRSFHRATQELQDMLIVLSREVRDAESRKKIETLDFWENCLPKSQLNKSDHLSASEAEMKLLSAALHGSVLTPEKNISKWFQWCNEHCSDALEKLIERKEFLRIKQGKITWIVSRKALAARNVK